MRLDGIRRSGIRCVFSFSPVFGEFEPAPSYAHPEDIRRLVKRDGDPRVSLALGYHVDDDLFRLARDLELPVFAHVNDANWGRRTLNAGPVNHAPGAVVQMMDTSNVETVLVDGHMVKRDGRLVGVDVDTVLDSLSRSAEGLLRRSGAPSVLLTSCRRG